MPIAFPFSKRITFKYTDAYVCCIRHHGQASPLISSTCFFYISMTFISICRRRFGDFLRICWALWVLQNTRMLSIFLGSMNFSILTMIFCVKYCKTFSFWFVKNEAKQMALTWRQVAYYIIVCVTTTAHFV